MSTKTNHDMCLKTLRERAKPKDALIPSNQKNIFDKTEKRMHQ